MNDSIFIYVLPISIVAIGLYLSFWRDILKDKSTSKKKPYSLGKVQLMWWTLIIVSCYCVYYGCQHELIKLSGSCVILLGISLATTTAAKMIDNTDIANNVARHQDEEGRDFLTDILEDENGLSVARFQTFIFNIIFGLVFLSNFFSKYEFKEFGNNELALMGISAAAYLGVKINENKV